jgi:hypothetical protein
LLFFKIVVEKKNGIKKGRRGKEKGCSKVLSLILFFTKHQLLFFFLDLGHDMGHLCSVILP